MKFEFEVSPEFAKETYEAVENNENASYCQNCIVAVLVNQVVKEPAEVTENAIYYGCNDSNDWKFTSENSAEISKVVNNFDMKYFDSINGVLSIEIPDEFVKEEYKNEVQV